MLLASNKPTTENLHENDDDFEMKNDDPIATESEPRGKKVRNKKLKSQIVTDLSQIDKEVETIEELDKLFTCRAAMLGEGLSAEKVYRLTLGNAKGIFITRYTIVFEIIQCFQIINIPLFEQLIRFTELFML